LIVFSAFVLEHNETRRTVRKWINVKKEYFTPDPIRNYDLAAMSEAAGRPNFSLKGITYRFL
uniref:Gustatory receptor n=1 Tax=Heligmosomoides polygyrus TaxID=6339 RepID=A0A183F8I4_HELPZ